MEQIIIGVVLVSLLAIAGICEVIDRIKIPDLPDCSRISNYCTSYGKKQGIKYVIKEPTRKESIDSLLSKIQKCDNSNIVYWRISLIISLFSCIFIWIFNRLEGTSIKTHTYFFIFIISWFINYWMRNFLDFHYHNHACSNIKNATEQLKSVLKSEYK